MLPAVNESDDPMTLDQTAHFSVLVVDDDGDDEWFDGQCEGDEWFGAASSEHATAREHPAGGTTGDDRNSQWDRKRYPAAHVWIPFRSS